MANTQKSLEIPNKGRQIVTFSLIYSVFPRPFLLQMQHIPQKLQNSHSLL